MLLTETVNLSRPHFAITDADREDPRLGLAFKLGEALEIPGKALKGLFTAMEFTGDIIEGEAPLEAATEFFVTTRSKKRVKKVFRKGASDVKKIALESAGKNGNLKVGPSLDLVANLLEEWIMGPVTVAAEKTTEAIFGDDKRDGQ
jgi:hypothetical protein